MRTHASILAVSTGGTTYRPSTSVGRDGHVRATSDTPYTPGFVKSRATTPPVGLTLLLVHLAPGATGQTSFGPWSLNCNVATQQPSTAEEMSTMNRTCWRPPTGAANSTRIRRLMPFVSTDHVVGAGFGIGAPGTRVDVVAGVAGADALRTGVAVAVVVVARDVTVDDGAGTAMVVDGPDAVTTVELAGCCSVTLRPASRPPAVELGVGPSTVVAARIPPGSRMARAPARAPVLLHRLRPPIRSLSAHGATDLSRS